MFLRRYVNSRDDAQLLGDIKKEPADDCSPFAVDTESKKPYVPCGAIANSMFSGSVFKKASMLRSSENPISFSDIIKLMRVMENGSMEAVPLIRTGIAWEADKKYKFKNPKITKGNLQDGT